MHGLVAKADYAFEVIQRPTGVEGAPPVSGVGTNGRKALFQYTVSERCVDDAANKTATASHHELAIPVIG